MGNKYLACPVIPSKASTWLKKGQTPGYLYVHDSRPPTAAMLIATPGAQEDLIMKI